MFRKVLQRPLWASVATSSSSTSPAIALWAFGSNIPFKGSVGVGLGGGFRSLVDVPLGGPSSSAGSSPGSRLKGATLDKRTGKWKASITVNKKRINLGSFSSEREASDAYFAAKAVYGDPVHGQSVFEGEFSVGKKGKKKANEVVAAADEDADESEDGELQPLAALRKGAAKVEEDDELVEVVEEGEEASPPSASSKTSTAKKEKKIKKSAPTDAAEAAPSAPSEGGFIGVVYVPDTFNTTTKTLGVWEAVITIPGKAPGEEAQEISGGDYDTPEEAARAYDALSRMYHGAGAKTNFQLDATATWVPPEEATFAAAQGVIEAKPGVPLTVDEIERALKAEKGIDIRTIDLAGKSDLAEHMIFVTGRDAKHMGKMADTISRALRKRKLKGIDPTVEAREMDDWMVVDCGNIIVNVMDEEAREVFALEPMYERMVDGEDPEMVGLSYDEWLEKNPIPEKWLRRLEKDEAEIEAAARVKSGANSRRASSAMPMTGPDGEPLSGAEAAKVINVGASLKRKRGTKKLKGGR
jgi:ribosome-associated protein